ncbi:MAG: ABC transporter ATP-binding protein [Terracidiphilus sp.]|jgi:putative ABC transport system ATP-binding protein
MEVAVRVRGVTKTYAERAARVTALEGVDLDLHKGELLFLMGPSGSGKTTLLSIMGCILRATSGSLQVAGQEITGLSERELPRVRLSHIGFVFQAFNLFPTLTAVENVEVALELKGIRGALARRQALSLLEQVHLDDKASAFPADLSGGQKQRVALARALAGNPEILLADEPTAALDSHTGRSVLELMRQLAHDHNRAVAVVTHDSRIADLGDRVVRIEDGTISSVRNLRQPEPALVHSIPLSHSDLQTTTARPL